MAPTTTAINRILAFGGKLFISITIGVVFVEVMLRLVPLKYMGYNSTFRFVSDNATGYKPAPNQDAVFNLECLRNPHVKTNSLGMRGVEWTDTAGPRIALLGDSYMLALTMSDDKHLATLLQAHTGAQVLNAGVSGYGTYQELLVWEDLLKERHPDITLLFVYLENDVRDSHCKLCRAENQIYCPCCEIKNGTVTERSDFEIRAVPETGWKEWLKKNCYTYVLLRKLKNETRTTENPKQHFFDKESFAYNVYRPNLSSGWQEGWQVFGWSVRELKRQCDTANSKLLIVNIGGVIQTAWDLQVEIKKQLGDDYIPDDFDIKYPINQLTAIADSVGVEVLDLLPPFVAYRNRYKLPEPVFSWCCDGHWNPLGHRLAADLVYNHLIQLKWIEGRPTPATPAPAEVLGPQLMEDIYTGQTVKF